jgi:hypothetical protein
MIKTIIICVVLLAVAAMIETVTEELPEQIWELENDDFLCQ